LVVNLFILSELILKRFIGSQLNNIYIVNQAAIDNIYIVPIRSPRAFLAVRTSVMLF